MNYTINFKLIERIPHIIMMNSFFIPDPGLYQGQMGIAIAMAKLYQQTENEVFLDFSYELLDQVISKVNKQLSFSLNEGLAGIGWGIEFFIQNDLVEGTGVEICEEIDYKIIETDPNRIRDFSLESGFEGLLHYILFHMKGAVVQSTKKPFDNEYLSAIYGICQKLDVNDAPESLLSLSKMFIDLIERNAYPNYEILPAYFISNMPEIRHNNLMSSHLGLNNGLSGYLLNTMRK